MLRHKEARDLVMEFIEAAIDKHSNINESNLVGLVVEYLGQKIIANKFKSSKYLVSTSQQVEKIKSVIPRSERQGWGISFPDSIIVKDLGDGAYQIIALAEYKSENTLHMEHLQVQFNGFLNLLDLLRGLARSRTEIIAALLGKKVKAIRTVEVAENPEVIYVVPYGRNAEYVSDSISGGEHFRQIRLPISVHTILLLIRQTRERRNKL